MQRLSQSPLAPAFVQDPYPFYDRARLRGDFFLWEEYGTPCAVSHRAVSAVLRDRRMGREVPAEDALPVPPHLADFYAIEAHSMLELEPPRHTRLRGLVLRAFTTRRIKALAPEMAALCDALIDAFPRGAFDLLDAYASRLPVIVIARLLGVPEDRADDLLRWSNAMVTMYQAGRSRATEQAAAAASRDFAAFIRDQIAARRAAPADDLISHLIAAGQAGDRLSTDEMISTCILLLNAGHEATVHTLGNGIRTLLGQDARPPVTGALVEEVLRHDPPIHVFTRWVYEDLTLLGHDFRRGDRIMCLLGAANRDPAAYPDPQRFDPARFVGASRAPQHTAFGGGIHFCVGAPLARLELLIGLDSLFRRCPGLRLAAPPRFANVYHFHGLAALHVDT